MNCSDDQSTLLSAESNAFRIDVDRSFEKQSIGDHHRMSSCTMISRSCTPSLSPSTMVPLKPGTDDSRCGRESCTGSSAGGDQIGMNEETLIKRGGMVVFSEAVAVYFIPRRSDYPKDIKRSIFPSKKEISANAARNMLEFASEEFDWRKAIEDEAMYIDSSGLRVHPVHLPKIWAERQVPSPAVPNLPRPKPQRPMHPNHMLYHPVPSRRSIEMLLDRPLTPSPFLVDGPHMD